MNAIVLATDRLHAGYVGAYGNAWIETPSLDRLAWESVAFDACLIESPRLDDFCRACWQGRHPLAANRPADAFPTLPAILSEAGVTTALLTDEPAVADHPLARAFDSIVRLDEPEFAVIADDVDDTHLATCFARLIEWLENAPQPYFAWCHWKAMGARWDAPREFRSRYAEADDPDPPDSAEVPCRMLDEDYDPDELLGVVQAYAGQVSLFDVCLGALLEFLDESRQNRATLLTLLSARGFPLGEHRRIGPCDDALHGELTHVPWLMRFPDGLGQSVRSPALVQPADLPPTLLDWWGIHALPPLAPASSLMPLAREDLESIRDRLALIGRDNAWALRTPAWYLRHADKPELFVKPDDRWEVNDVADRCHEVVELLEQVYSGYAVFLRSGNLEKPPPLDEVLLSGLE